MKKIVFMFLALSLIVFSGCQTAPSTTTQDQPKEEENTSFLGKWQRTANYYNGELINTASSVTTLRGDGTYTSVGTCFVSGTFGYDDRTNTITTTIGSTNCEGGVGAGYVSTWSFELSKDGNNLTMNTGGVTETFIRLE